MSATAGQFVKRSYVYISNKLRYDAVGELEAPFANGTNTMRPISPPRHRVAAKGKLDSLLKSLYATYG